MVLPRIHHRFLKLFGATLFKPEKMAKSMESTCQKTFTPKWTLLHLAAVLFFILLIYPALSAVGQNKVVRVTDGDTVKVKNNDKTIIVRLVGKDAPETSKKKNEPGQLFSQKSTKTLSIWFLNESVDKNCCGDDRYGQFLRVFFVDYYVKKRIPPLCTSVLCYQCLLHLLAPY